MVMEAAPAATLVVREAELLLELLVISFNTPAHFDDEDQLFQGGVGRRRGEKVFHRLGFRLGPLDQQPLLGAHLGAQVIAVSRTDPHSGETRG
ncbi:hypothetical protein AWB78_08706 [Caballeronia calidae]|uniref:Uncharacterized protein n=1 Tax=Caballeronia calidae TaxID=1777139 RepID=A0A158ELI6_9BURK|nr:hypothetical protein AWB78_08706 [Caballeronia calidae]